MNERIKCSKCQNEFDKGKLIKISGEYYCKECLKENLVECACCGNFYPKDKMTQLADGKYACEDCVDMEGIMECECCGKFFYGYQLITVANGDKVCESCCDTYYTLCDCCQEYVSNDSSIYEVVDTGEQICDDCVCNGYADVEFCDCCGELYSSDNIFWDDEDEVYYCNRCAPNRLVLSYHGFDNRTWKKHRVRTTDKGVFMGFELEVEPKNYNSPKREEVAKSLNDILEDNGYGDKELLVYEQDGSLNDGGFEIISHPMSMDFIYQNEELFKKVLDKLKDMKYISHNSSTCGLHIHVGRHELISDNDLAEYQVINNITLLMEGFREELIKFSRRNLSSIKHWACFLSMEKYSNSEEPVPMRLSYKGISDRKKSNSDYVGRYLALNLTNAKTIEFRLFKGTLNFNSFMSCLELVDSLVEHAKTDNLNGITWLDIIDHGKYLKDYCASRDLLIDKKLILEEKYNEL